MTNRDIYDDNGNRYPAQRGDADPAPRRLLAQAIQRAESKGPHGDNVRLYLPHARAILHALQEAERRELHATLGGEEGMP